MGRKKTKKTNKTIYLIAVILISILGYFGLLPEELQREKIVVSESIIENIIIDEEKLNILFFDQTTPNMIQGLKGIFARKPLISRGI